MHLLTLLIAAVFSSQFVAPNSGVTIEPAIVHADATADIVITNGDSEWTGNVAIQVSVSATEPTYEAGATWHPATKVENVYTVADFDFSEVAITAETKFKVWIATDVGGTATVRPTALEIDITAITEITTTLTGITQLNLLMGLPAFTVTATGHTTETLTFVLANSEDGSGKKVTVTGTAGANGLHTFDAAQPAVTLVDEDQLYIIASDGTNSYVVGPLAVAEAQAWTIAADRADPLFYETELAATPGFVLTKGATETWYDGMKIKIAGNSQSTGFLEVANADRKVASPDLSSLAITTAMTPVDLTVTLFLDGSAKEHPKKATLTVKKAAPVFSLNTTELTKAQLVANTKFVITGPASTGAWASGDTVKVALVRTRTVPLSDPAAAYFVPAAFNSASTKWDVTFDLSQFPADESDLFIYVYIKYKQGGGGGEVYLPTPFEIAYDGVPEPVGEFSLDPVKFTYAQMKGKTTPLKFIDDSTAGDKTEWTSPMTAMLSYNSIDITASVVKAAGPPVVWSIATPNLDDLLIPVGGATVSVKLAPKPVVGNVKYLPDAVDFVVEPKLPVFTIDITEVQASGIASVAFGLTPDAGAETTAWKTAGTTVHATFTPTDTPPVADGTYTFRLDAPDSGATAFNGTAVLTGFDFASLPDNKIYVWAKVTPSGGAGVWRDVPRTVTYVASSDPTFGLNIAALAEEDMKTLAVEVTPNPLTAFDDKTILIGFTTASTFTTPTVTLAVTKDATDNKWKATGDISALTITAQTTNVYAWVKIDAAWLTSSVTLPFTPAPVPDFTVTPTTIDLRTDPTVTITVEQTVQTTKWVEKVHFYLATSKLTDPTTGTKKTATVTTGAKDKWAVTGVVLEDITGMAKDKTLYVWVEHGETAAGGDGVLLKTPATISITKSDEPAEPEAAMGVSPFLSLLAALVFLFVKLF